MPECSFCAAPACTFHAKAQCATCQRPLCDTCKRPLCAPCCSRSYPAVVAHALRLRAACVVLEGEGGGALEGLLDALLELVTRDYARWRLRRPEAPLAEWLRLCDARLASMERAPPGLRCELGAVLQWLATAPPRDELVHPQTPSPELPGDRGRPVLWVPTLIDGARLANPRVCGGCLYHPPGGPAAVPQAKRARPLPEPDHELRRANVEEAVELVRASNDPAVELAARRQQQLLGAMLLDL